MGGVWTNKVPTAMGYYRLRDCDGDETVGHLLADGRWRIASDLCDAVYVRERFYFGPRIPSGDELAALQRDAARYRKLEAAATAGIVADKPLWYLQPMARTGTFGEAVDAIQEGDGNG